MASRTHSVNGFKTVGPMQTQRNHSYPENSATWDTSARGALVARLAVESICGNLGLKMSPKTLN